MATTFSVVYNEKYGQTCHVDNPKLSAYQYASTVRHVTGKTPTLIFRQDGSITAHDETGTYADLTYAPFLEKEE